MKDNLKAVGFPRVHNVPVDCYKTWSTGIGYPEFDILVTNPPYSDDHIPKLLRHVCSRNFGSRPWLLLLPTWVHKKGYFKSLVTVPCFYIVPKKRYVYHPPKQFRAKKNSDVHKKSSPFISMWYVWGGDEGVNNGLFDYYRTVAHEYDCEVARSKSALRDLRRKASKKGR